MNRTELQISFNQKDTAKECARNAGTRIMWDASKKVWYWEGEENCLPECLKQYAVAQSIATPQSAYTAEKFYTYVVMEEPVNQYKSVYRVLAHGLVLDGSNSAEATSQIKLLLEKERHNMKWNFSGRVDEWSEDDEEMFNYNCKFLIAKCKVLIRVGKCLVPEFHNKHGLKMSLETSFTRFA